MARKSNSSSTKGVPLPHLREWRVRKLMSMRDLSEKSGVSTNTINALENQRGRARFETIGKLAKGLAITPDQLTFQAPPSLPGEQAESEAGNERRGVA